MILVTGATGVAGSQVVHGLVALGAPVRALVRDREKAGSLFSDDVELVVGDFAEPESVRAAVRGAEAVLLSCADDPRRIEWEASAIDSAVAAGVARVVRLSTVGAAPDAPVAFWRWHGEVEQRLRESEVPSVILESSFYMSNLYDAAGTVGQEGRLYAPAGDARVAMIDPRDVGAVAAAVLTGAGDDGQTYVLTGPDAITWARVAAELSVATGRRVEFVDVPYAAARSGMLESGLPDRVADEVVKVFQQLRQGVAEEVTDHVESLTGRPPTPFAVFARDNARVFEANPLAAAR